MKSKKPDPKKPKDNKKKIKKLDAKKIKALRGGWGPGSDTSG